MTDYPEATTDEDLLITEDLFDWALFIAEKHRSLAHFKVISEDSVAKASRYIDLWLHQNGGHVA